MPSQRCTSESTPAGPSEIDLDDATGDQLDLDIDLRDSLQRHGEMIGAGYRLENVIGLGGMGVVYEALQESLGRKVAVKLARPELANDPVVRARMRAEARAAARLNHRNVVRVLDYGEHAGTPFLVMELVRGPRLRELARKQGPFEPAHAAPLVLQILSALDEAHQAGVLHADIKSDNVIVETQSDGTPLLRLIDFGLARFSEPAPMTSPPPIENLISGTPEYLAPEVIRGSIPTVSSDLYAVGIILYELIVGVTPFLADTNIEIMNGHLAGDLTPMASHCPGRVIPVAYEKLVRRALSRDPATRFPSAQAFGEALQNVLVLPMPPARSHTSRAFARTRNDVTPVLGVEVLRALPDARNIREVTPALRSSARARRRAAAATELARRRHDVDAAIAHDDTDGIVIAYLELARVHVEAHEILEAIEELEAGVTMLLDRSPSQCRSVWRLQLTLAALYDKSGNRMKAQELNQAARVHAERAGSRLGTERAQQLARRLGVLVPRLS